MRPGLQADKAARITRSLATFGRAAAMPLDPRCFPAPLDPRLFAPAIDPQRVPGPTPADLARLAYRMPAAELALARSLINRPTLDELCPPLRREDLL